MRWTGSFPRALICAMSISVMTACASGTAGMRDAACPAPEASLLEPITPAPPARSAKLPDLMDNHRETAELLAVCRQRHEDLAEAAVKPKPREPRWWEFWEIYW